MMNSEAPLQRYADLDTLSRELALQIAAALTAAIAARGLASLVVSGGRSPVQLVRDPAHAAARLGPRLHRAGR